ncbi:MAG: heavy metal-responsive transcriptional regulator [Nitrospira sp.]
MAAQLTIGQLARIVGVNVQTGRYYECLNLLRPSARRPSRYRLYGHEEEGRLRFIKKAQALGFTLHEIAELLTLRIASTACRDDVQKRAQAKLLQVESKVQDLRVLALVLKQLIQACEAGQPTDGCPILMSLEKETNADTKERIKGC